MLAYSLPVGALGGALVLLIVWDAFETILVPRRIGRRVRLTRYFYILAWRVWRACARALPERTRRDGLISFFGPLSLILLLGLWASGLIVAFALIQWSLEAHLPTHPGFFTMLYMSGETFFTLGFGDITPASALGRAFSVAEAGLGFGFLGTVVGYLPTMYGAFSQREVEISLMDARAGSPPTAAEFLRRTPPADPGSRCTELMRGWERWAAQLLETHISYPQLAYYRSQHGNQSWLGSLTLILDATAAILATLEDEESSQARLTFAMARHALVDITQIFVPQFRTAPDRMTPEALATLLERARKAGVMPGAEPAFVARLAELRLLYEPYASALATHLEFTLPPWAHAEPRRDNWERGPWDQFVPGTEHALSRDEHF